MEQKRLTAQQILFPACALHHDAIPNAPGIHRHPPCPLGFRRCARVAGFVRRRLGATPKQASTAILAGCRE